MTDRYAYSACCLNRDDGQWCPWASHDHATEQAARAALRAHGRETGHHPDRSMTSMHRPRETT